MSEELKDLDLADLPQKVRCPLEDYLQHRAQMRGNRSCTRVVLSRVAVAFTEQTENRHWRDGKGSKTTPVPRFGDGHSC